MPGFSPPISAPANQVRLIRHPGAGIGAHFFPKFETISATPLWRTSESYGHTSQLQNCSTAYRSEALIPDHALV